MNQTFKNKSFFMNSFHKQSIINNNNNNNNAFININEDLSQIELITNPLHKNRIQSNRFMRKKSTDTQTSNHIIKSSEKFIDKSVEKSVEKCPEKSVDNSAEKSVENSADKSVEKSVERYVEMLFVSALID